MILFALSDIMDYMVFTREFSDSFDSIEISEKGWREYLTLRCNVKRIKRKVYSSVGFSTKASSRNTLNWNLQNWMFSLLWLKSRRKLLNVNIPNMVGLAPKRLFPPFSQRCSQFLWMNRFKLRFLSIITPSSIQAHLKSSVNSSTWWYFETFTERLAL